MSRGRLAGLLIAGLALRLAVMATTSGLAFDLGSLASVRQALATHPLDLYREVNHTGLLYWPYPPGYFPVVAVAGWISTHFGLSFTWLMRLIPALADLALAFLLQSWLGARGANPRVRLLAAAGVVCGPLFIAISAYNGQLDAVALVPELLAFICWERFRPERRALPCGLMIGLGTLIKVFPALGLLALLPSCRSRREVLGLLLGGLGLPLLVLLPWLLTTPHAVIYALSYSGLSGQGGISLLVEPGLAQTWLGLRSYHGLSGVNSALGGHLGIVIYGLALALVFSCLLRRRTPAPAAAALIWLTTLAFSVNFNPRYGVWGIPFYLGLRWWKSTAALQVALVVPTILLFLSPVHDGWLAILYATLMLGVWAVATAACLRLTVGRTRT